MSESALPSSVMSGALGSLRAQAEQRRLRRWSDRLLLAALYRSAGPALAVQAIGAILLLTLLVRNGPACDPLAWGLAFGAVLLARWAVVRRGRHLPLASLAALRQARWAWDVSVLACGVMWSLAVWLFFAAADVPHRATLALLVMSLPAVQPLTRFPLYALCLSQACLSLAVNVAYYGETTNRLDLAMVLVTGLLLGLWVAHRLRLAFIELFTLKLTTDRQARQLERKKVAAERARREAEEAGRRRTSFFTAASHDLRQPLHALTLLARALQASAQPAAGADPADDDNTSPRTNTLRRPPLSTQMLAQRVTESVQVLSVMFDEVLDLSRLESAAITVQRDALSMAEVARQLHAQFEPLATGKGLQLRMRTQGCRVDADPVALRRILNNLLANAIRYSEQGGVLFTCRPRGGKVALQVWDTGRGITPEALPHVFEPYYQGGGGSRLGPPGLHGLGLGLAIVKRLADLLEAPLSVRSEPGRGTVFTLTLPVAAAADRPSVAAAPTPTFPSVTLAGQVVWLVVADEALRAQAAGWLRQWQATVHEAHNAASDTSPAGQGQGPRPGVLIIDLPAELVVDAGLGAGAAAHVSAATTGVAARLAALRATWGLTPLPTIVLGADPLLAQALVAADPAVHTLPLPLAANRLRALVAYKLSAKSSESL
ncbi:MAG: HAMP domain-containing sensor histidine kinase [Burkholderiales bacterium]